MKYPLFIASLLALMLAGCIPKTSPEERRANRIAEQQRKVNELNAQFHACDKNGGIQDIQQSCSRGGCWSTIVKCNDGMQREFPR